MKLRHPDGEEYYVEEASLRSRGCELYLTNYHNIYFEGRMVVDGEEEWTKIKIAEHCFDWQLQELKRRIKESGMTGREFLENRGDEVPNGLDISCELLGMSR